MIIVHIYDNRSVIMIGIVIIVTLLIACTKKWTLNLALVLQSA